MVFSTNRRECPSAICRGEGILSIQRIECLHYTERVSLLFLYTKERVSSLHGEESVPSDVPVSKELMEPPDMYSSGEFNDNATRCMTR